MPRPVSSTLQDEEGQRAPLQSPDDLGATTDPEVLHKRLQDCYGHSFEASVWDSSLFLWLPGVGSWISLLALMALILNIVMQLGFCYIVSEHMIKPAIDGGTLSQLLKFRANAAHTFQNADQLTQRSLGRSICTSTSGADIYMATSQAELQHTARVFRQQNAGRWLAILVQLCWVGSVCRDLVDTFLSVSALWGIVREGTEIESTEEGGELSLSINSISSNRFAGMVVLTVVPRVLIAISLGITGVQFLAQTLSLSDLVLNSLALTFIFELDELIYHILVPLYLHVMVNSMRPLRTMKVPAGSFTVVVMVGISVALVVSYVKLIWPIEWNLEMANHIVCGGNRDFVFVPDKATGMMHVAQSSPLSVKDGVFWSDDELAVLKETNMSVELWSPRENGWNVKDDVMSLSSDVARVVRFNGSTLEAFEYLKRIEVSSAADVVATAPCVDRTTVAEARAYLARKYKVGNYTCGEDLPGFTFATACSMYNMTHLRAMCPQACGCGHVSIYQMKAAAFDSVDFGCPRACEDRFRGHRRAAYLNSQGSTQDTDDKSSFTPILSSMPNLLNIPGTSDGPSVSQGRAEALYALVNAFYMGVKEVVMLKSRQARQIHAHNQVIGMLMSQSLPTVCYDGNDWANAGQFPCDATKLKHTEFINHLTDGKLIDSILDGNWMLHPAVPHPRGKAACEFFTSWELRTLLGHDVCSTDHYGSIRGICPIECGCKSGMDSVLNIVMPQCYADFYDEEFKSMVAV